MSGAAILEGLREAIPIARAIPTEGMGPCPMPPTYAHVIGPWDTSFTGGREGVSCRRCHKTWLLVDGEYRDTYEHNAAIPQTPTAEGSK